MLGTVWCLHGHPRQHSAAHSILPIKMEIITSEHMNGSALCLYVQRMTGVTRHVHLVHSEVTRQPGHCGYTNGSQSGGVCGGSGAECYVCSKETCYEFVQVQTSPGL